MKLIKSIKRPTITIVDNTGTTVINRTDRKLFGITIGYKAVSIWTGKGTIINL